MNRDEFKKHIGAQIKERRTALRISQDHLANVLRVSRSSVSNIENGRQVVTFDKMADLCKLLCCTTNDLLPPFKITKQKIKEQGDWERLSEKLPTDDNSWVLFAQWTFNCNNTPVIISEYLGTWGDVKRFRQYDLKHAYTHWTYIKPPIKKQKYEQTD
jgi:transcriptional regulator with XRE-family HTH domain